MARFIIRPLLLSEIASSMCYLPDCTIAFLYQMFCFGRARDADITFILFIRPQWKRVYSVYASKYSPC